MPGRCRRVGQLTGGLRAAGRHPAPRPVPRHARMAGNFRRLAEDRDRRDRTGSKLTMNTRQPSTPTPAGTQRRLRALMSRGWSPEAIERATGLPARESARALEDRRRISAEAAARVSAAYDRLWDRPPPQGSDDDRKLAAGGAPRARAR